MTLQRQLADTQYCLSRQVQVGTQSTTCFVQVELVVSSSLVPLRPYAASSVETYKRFLSDSTSERVTRTAERSSQPPESRWPHTVHTVQYSRV